MPKRRPERRRIRPSSTFTLEFVGGPRDGLSLHADRSNFGAGKVYEAFYDDEHLYRSDGVMDIDAPSAVLGYVGVTRPTIHPGEIILKFGPLGGKGTHT